MPQFPAVVVWVARVYRCATGGFAAILIGAGVLLMKPLALDGCLAVMQAYNNFVARVYKYSGNDTLAVAFTCRADRVAERRRKLVSSIR